MQVKIKSSAIDGPQNFLLVGDPNEPGTWLFRIATEAGQLDLGFIEKVKVQLVEGFHQDIFSAELLAWAFAKLRQLYTKPNTESTEHEHND
ncbi:MAG TPA: hypothetical protein VMH87_07795 [Pseudomonadales bacterium]|nr:hypothetical protein [Pseudomonadales bacterium]